MLHVIYWGQNETLKFINLSFTFKSIWNDSYRDALWTRVDRELYVHCSKIIEYSPSKARISAFTFSPSQLTVTVFHTMKGVSLSKISWVGAIPVFISCGKRYAFFRALLLSLQSCLTDMMFSTNTYNKTELR